MIPTFAFIHGNHFAIIVVVLLFVGLGLLAAMEG